MKFIGNRKIMLEHLKTMVKIVPKESPVKELRCFLIEANEDDGYLYITANNFEVAIQRKFKADIEVGGSFAIEAKLLTDMLNLLSGDEVEFELQKPGLTNIKSGKCVYSVKVLEDKLYPKPEIPFPDAMVNIGGIKQMYLKTYSSVASNEIASEAMKGIHFEIGPNGFKTESCNCKEMSIATRKMPCGGKLEFVLPKQTFMYLSSCAGDDELEVGVSGNSVVFIKEGLLFSTRKIAADYIDIGKILDSVKPVYTAKIEHTDLKNVLLNTCDIASMGTETSYIKFEFGKDEIIVSTSNDVGMSHNELNCVLISGSADTAFYYPSSTIKSVLKTVEGKLIVQVDKRGYLLIFDQFNKFMITPMTDMAVKKQEEKMEGYKNKSKSKKNVKEIKKAA